MLANPEAALWPIVPTARRGGLVDRNDDRDVARQVQIMTTMHFVLSGTRASTVYESIGRAGMYLTTVSMTLVALGFVSSATSMGKGFYVFAFLLLSCLIPLGLVTFNRVVQTGVQDLRLSFNEARIHQFYADVSPGIDKWFDHPVGDTKSDHVLLTAGSSRFQILFTAGSMVGGVNSAVIGVLIGLAVMHFTGASLFWVTALGAASFVVAGWLHLRLEYDLFANLHEPAIGLEVPRS